MSKNSIDEASHKLRVEHFFSKESFYWNRVYCDDPCSASFISYWLVKRKEIILSLLKKYLPEQSNNILDAGCGAGVYMRELIKLNHIAFGADFSLRMIQEARISLTKESQVKASFAAADLEKLPFKNEVFNAVLCVGVLQYLKKDNIALSELFRVVKKGGIVIITIPNILRFHMLFDPYYYAEGYIRLLNKLAKLDSFNKDDNLYSPPHRSNRSYWNRRYYYGKLDHLFRKAGFIKLRTEAVAFSPLTIWQFPLLTHSLSIKFSQLLIKCSQFRSLSWLTMISDRWVILLKKA